MENKSKRCSRCGVKLDENTIGFFSESVNYYRIYLDDLVGGLGYRFKTDESLPKDKFGFYCRDCGADLSLSEEEVIEILKEV